MSVDQEGVRLQTEWEDERVWEGPGGACGLRWEQLRVVGGVQGQPPTPRFGASFRCCYFAHFLL